MLNFIWRSFQNHWRSKGLLFLVPLCFSSSYFSYDFQWYVQRISNATPSRVSITLLDGSPLSFCECLASSTGAPVSGITGMPRGSPGIFVQGFWVNSIGTSEDECLPGCPAYGSSVNFPNSVTPENSPTKSASQTAVGVKGAFPCVPSSFSLFQPSGEWFVLIADISLFQNFQLVCCQNF